MRRDNDFWPHGVPRELHTPSGTLWDNLEASARRNPDKAGLIFFGTELSFDTIRSQAESVAGWLSSTGVARGDRVLVYMQNCPQFIIACYGIFRIGAVVVPVNPMNRMDELRHIIADCRPRAAFVAAELALVASESFRAEALSDPQPPIVVTEYRDTTNASSEDIDEPSAAPLRDMLRPREAKVPGTIEWLKVIAEGIAPPRSVAAPDELALLPYTSGTTGMPKGCMHTHQSLMHNAMFGRWTGKNDETVNLSVTPMFHITGMMDSVLGGIFDGATSVLLPRWNSVLAAKLISRYRITHWTTIPTMVIDLFGGSQFNAGDFTSLRAIIGGGTAMPSAVAERLRTELGLTYIEGYGLTETAAPTHCNPPDRPKPECLGIPIFGVESRVVDPETLADQAPGEIGEILVRGPMVFMGYWNQQQATDQAFVSIDGKLFFRTGDLGRKDNEGYFYIADRIKRMINASGYKVWPSEVELLLFKCPWIHEACVIGVKDSYRGETVKALIVPKPEYREEVSALEVIEWARSRMAAYKVPRLVEFVDSLPKSNSGKVLWRELQALHSS